MLESLKLAWDWLGPLQYLTVTLALLVSIDLWKKLHPKSWNWLMLRAPYALELSKAQELAHNLLMALPQVLGSALVAALVTGGDLKASAFAAIAGAGAPLSHHAKKWVESLKKKPPGGGDQQPVGLKDPEPTRIRFTPPDPVPPDAAYSLLPDGSILIWAKSIFVRAPAVVFVALALCLVGCGASGWEAQRTAANATAHVANDIAHPAVVAAYKATAQQAMKGHAYQEDALSALANHKEKWKPLLGAFVAFQEAHKAWQAAIDAKGDPLPSAIAARESYCRARKLAVEFDIDLPNIPGIPCK
jgi:hypothetical protein